MSKENKSPREWTDEEREEWLIENEALIHSIVNSYIGDENTSKNREDYFQIGSTAALLAMDEYVGQGAKFTTFAYTVISNKIKDEIKKDASLKRNAPTVSLDQPFNDDMPEGLLNTRLDFIESTPEYCDTIGDTIFHSDINTLVKDLLSILTPEQRIITEYQYGLNGKPKKSQAEIADILFISQSKISTISLEVTRILRRALKARNIHSFREF